MNTLSVSQETRPAQITSRRGTLERQCSIGTHSNPATLKDVTPDPSSLSTLSLSRASFSSSHSLSTGQSVDEVFGVPDTLETKTSTSSSNDKSNSASTIQMSKAGRKRKHPMKPGKYICKYCSKPCAKPSVLEKHLRKHTGERPFPCDACDHSFKTRSNLYKHLKSSTHLQKCKEKGISMESLYGESFGSSRDESLDMDGEEETPALQLHKRASSVGGFTDRKPYPPKQPSYLETLRDLEKVYDAIDAYARMMGTVVCKHSHWLLDKDCIISVHLQHPPAVLAGNNGAVDVGSKSDKAIDVQARITNLLKVNDEIINSPGKRRLSRQQSVSSPSNQMLNSEPGASQGQLGPQATPDMSVVMHQISARSYLDTKSRLPDGEELLKHIREIIQLNPSFDSNIKLLMHEHVMEVKLKLFIPDAAARRKCIQGLSVDSSIDNQHGTGRGLVKERRFPCEGCNQSFSREHILEIHSSFFCYGLLPENRKKMKLLKTGSEDSYVYVIADDGYSPSKYVKVAPEVSLQSAVLQQSSVEASSEGGTMKQQLKMHVLKHMSQGSFNSETTPLTSSNALPGFNKSFDEKALGIQDMPAASIVPAMMVSGEAGGGMTQGSPRARVPEDIARTTLGQSITVPPSILVSTHQTSSSQAPLVISVLPAISTVTSASPHTLTSTSGTLTLSTAASAESHVCVTKSQCRNGPAPQQSHLTAVCISDGNQPCVGTKSSFSCASSDSVLNTPTADKKLPEENLADIIPSTVTMFDCGSPIEEVEKKLPEIRGKMRVSPEAPTLNNKPPAITVLDSKAFFIASPVKFSPVVTIRDSKSYGLTSSASSPRLPSSLTSSASTVTILEHTPSPLVSASVRPSIVASSETRVPVESVAHSSATALTLPVSKPCNANVPVNTFSSLPVTVAFQVSGPLTNSSAAYMLPMYTSASSGSPVCSTASNVTVTVVGVENRLTKAASAIDRPSNVVHLDNKLAPNTVLRYDAAKYIDSTAKFSVPISQNLQLSASSTHQELNNRTGESDTHPTPKVATIVLSSTTLPVPLVGPGMAIVPTTNAMQLSADNIMLAKSLSEPVYVKVLTTDASSTLSPRSVSLRTTPIVLARKDAERVSSLRRRFSQARSKSSVSFDDPPVKQPTHLSVPILAWPEPSRSLTKGVESLSAASSISKEAFSSGVVTSHIVSTTVISITSINSSKVQDFQDCFESHRIQLASFDVELTSVYCTINRRAITFDAESVCGSSHYSKWTRKSHPPASQLADLSLPLSCYNSSARLTASGYKNSKMDTRSIFTHSSYWQYKEKMRVMQSMPVQLSTSQSSDSVEMTSSISTSALSSSQSIASISVTPPVIPPVTKLEQPVASCASTASSLPAVTTLQVPSLKKPFHRSQSTPNAGEESQSKLIAGGFKSDEDYVYIRGKGKGKFVCQQCGIRCRKPSMLKKHIRTHTDLRPYSCRHCTFSFKTKGNLTKHMRSKAHHRRCLELHIIPVPLTVEDNQIDRDILASQHRLSRQSKIQGAKLSEQEKALQEDSDSSEDDEQSEEEEASEESSEDDALHIDESSDDADKSTDSAAPRLNMASLRRVQSMPAHHQANSFDASSLAEIMQTESETQAMPSQPPPKKRKRNHLNLTLNAGELQGKETNLGRCTEDDVAMSLLDLSKTPVHGTPTFIKQNSLSKPLLHTGSTKSPLPADVQRVSVVRSTKASADDYPVEQDYNEPIDLRIHSKAPQLRFICPLCRAICNSQESLEKHMKLHDGPVIEVSNKSNKRLMSSSHSLGNSFDADSRPKSQTQIGQPLTPQTPGPLRRQQAINIFDSDAEDDVDHTTKVEPGEMLSEEVLRHKCPYCPKVFHSEDSVPLHIKSHHVITQEYVCTYKDCGVKFSNKQDLTYHLGSHALDDNEKYQPISIPKCGICEKTFKSMNSLKQHLQHHSDARPHICEYCDAGFTTSQFLKNHLKTHTQERPYVCGECDSTFARSDHLTQHAKTHNKQLPCDMQNRVAAQAPTILNPAGAKLHHHLTL